MYTLRRWSELHGDLPLGEIKREHLNQFDEALKKLPPALGEHRRLSLQQSITKGQKDGKAPIGLKSRETALFHMKSLIAYAVDRLGAIPADPFAGYIPGRKQRKATVKYDKRRYKLRNRPSRDIAAQCSAGQ